MTVLSPSKLILSNRQRVWDVVAELSQAQHWIEGLERAEHLRGETKGIGGVWRFHCKWNDSSHVFDFEITEWMKGHRLGVRPSRQTAVVGGVQYFQFVLDLKDASPSSTLVEIEFNYEPLSKLTRLKNLAFLRRKYLDFIGQTLDRLAGVALAAPHA
jgi:hypothetical protein